MSSGAEVAEQQFGEPDIPGGFSSGDQQQGAPLAPGTGGSGHYHSHGPHHASAAGRKKRHHGNVTAAMTARRLAGLNASGGHHATGHDADEDDGGQFISSSRDASEEDNDDASGYSDSASSFRLPSSSFPHPSLSSTLHQVLPTSARDRALIDSKHSHRRPSASAYVDKTPSSSSPPRQTVPLQSQLQTGGLESVNTAGSNKRPSAPPKDATVSATLAQASAALSSSSSTDLGNSQLDSSGEGGLGEVNISGNAGEATSGVAVSSVPRHGLNRTASMSSAGSDMGNGPPRFTPLPSTGKLDLMSLPNPVLSHGTTTAVATPRAPDSIQKESVMAPALGGTSKRKVSSSNQGVPSGINAAPFSSSSASSVGGGNTEASKPSKASGNKKNGTDETDEGEGTDGTAASPYDGDVEFAARTPLSQQVGIAPSSSSMSGSAIPSSAPSLPTTSSVAVSSVGLGVATAPTDIPTRPYLSTSTSAALTTVDGQREQPETLADEQQVTIAPVASIRDFIYSAIYEPDPKRDYRINLPPDGGRNPARPVRIYADGVYDLFHYAHALQLRQAKLFFPSVHLIVGVVSSASCAKHKNAPVLSSSERYASVRNCRWVDEVVEDAPWIINQELLDRLQVDYVAHDEEPYGGSDGSNDIYRFVKDQGRFLPTLRTPGVSTSELLARIVGQYRDHVYDGKLEKIGHGELAYQ